MCHSDVMDHGLCALRLSVSTRSAIENIKSPFYVVRCSLTDRYKDAGSLKAKEYSDLLGMVIDHLSLYREPNTNDTSKL